MEWRERWEDGELVSVTEEDKLAAQIMAARMDEVVRGRQYLHNLLALGLLCESVVAEIAGPDWAAAVKKVIDGVPV